MRTEYLDDDIFNMLLFALMPANRRALEVSLLTGLRISDVLALKTQQIQRQRFTVLEMKTGKAKRVYLPEKLRLELCASAGRVFVFQSRGNVNKPRTRQAVYKDLKRVAALYRIDGRKIRQNIAPHSARKIYAVAAFRQSHDIKKVQALLNHSSEAVTILYAFADSFIKGRKCK